MLELGRNDYPSRPGAYAVARAKYTEHCQSLLTAGKMDSVLSDFELGMKLGRQNSANKVERKVSKSSVLLGQPGRHDESGVGSIMTSVGASRVDQRLRDYDAPVVRRPPRRRRRVHKRPVTTSSFGDSAAMDFFVGKAPERRYSHEQCRTRSRVGFSIFSWDPPGFVGNAEFFRCLPVDRRATI